MKKLCRKLLSAALAVFLALVGVFPCFAKDGTPPSPDVEWLYVDGSGVNNGLFYFILPGDVRLGEMSASFAVHGKDGVPLYSGTMADFETRALSDGRTLALICRSQDALYGQLHFGEGAFVRADGTPFAAFATNYSDANRWSLDADFYAEQLLRISSTHGTTVEGKKMRFSFWNMEELPEDLFTLEKCAQGETTLLADRAEITDDTAALVTTAEVGSAEYIVRYDGKEVYRTYANVLSAKEYRALLVKDRMLSAMLGLALIPCLPIYLGKGFVNGIAASIILAPMAIFSPLIILGSAGESGIIWARNVAYYLTGFGDPIERI